MRPCAVHRHPPIRTGQRGPERCAAGLLPPIRHASLSALPGLQRMPGRVLIEPAQSCRHRPAARNKQDLRIRVERRAGKWGFVVLSPPVAVGSRVPGRSGQLRHGFSGDHAHLLPASCGPPGASSPTPCRSRVRERHPLTGGRLVVITDLRFRYGTTARWSRTTAAWPSVSPYGEPTCSSRCSATARREPWCVHVAAVSGFCYGKDGFRQ